MAKQKPKLYLSPSSLGYFYESRCPAAWHYNTKLIPIGEVNEAMARGTLVHALLEGTISLGDVTDQKAAMLYDKINSIRSSMNIQIDQTEIWQEFEIIPGVIWRRRLDAIGSVSGYRTTIIDYKTAGGGWKTIPIGDNVISPQSLGFQSIGYAVPMPGVKNWPVQVMFIVAGYRGPAQIFTYTYNKVDHKNLLDAIRLVKTAYDTNSFPKVRGYACAGSSTEPPCPFLAPCFNEPNWAAKFTEKKHGKHETR